MSSATNRKELLDAIEPTQEGIHMYLEGKSRKLTDRELSYLLRKNTALYKRVIDNNLTFDDIRYFLLTNTPIEPKYCEVCHKQVHILHGHISRGFPRTCSNACKNKLVGIANVKLTEEERDLVDCISTIYKGEIRTHVRDVIAPYELDIYIPEKRLAIEFNGAYWYNTSAGKDSEYHLAKTNMCEARGIHLIHIWEWDWVNNRNKVFRRLMAYLGENCYTLFARKCHASVLTAREDIEQAKDMLNNIHLQGDIPAKVYVALYDDDGKMEAVMSFGKPRFNKDYQWELYRYCSDEKVIGGASKLLKCFVRNYYPKSIITYADRCWSSKNSNVYKAMGFEYVGDSKPSYVYANRNGQILSRYQCQKARIAEEGDNELKETEIMAKKGYFKVYDCGNLIYSKKF